MSIILLLVVVLSIIGICLTASWLISKSISTPISHTAPAPHPTPFRQDARSTPNLRHAPIQHLPYARIPHLMTPAERDLYALLRSVVPADMLIFAQVRLANLVQVTSRNRQRKYDFYKIQAKCVDFVLCDAGTSEPLLVIELDDSSHQLHHRRERDAFVDAVLQQVNIPILHINWQRVYHVDEIARKIAQLLHRQSLPQASSVTTPRSQAPGAGYTLHGASNTAHHHPPDARLTPMYSAPAASHAPPAAPSLTSMPTSTPYYSSSIVVDAPVTDMAYSCGKCHQTVRKHARYCQHCGAVLAGLH